MKRFGFCLLALLLLCACGAVPAEEAWPPVLRDPLPAIDWLAIPVGSPEKETMPALGCDEVEDTSPQEGADSFADSDRLAPLAVYTFSRDFLDPLPDFMKVTLCGAPVEHVSVGCRGGIVHYVTYSFRSGDFAGQDAYWDAARTLRQELETQLAGTAELEERYSAEKLNAEAFSPPYIAHWKHGGYNLEMEVWEHDIQIRLRYPNHD